jgi:hypothetical protein
MTKLVTCQVKSEHIVGISGKTFSYYGHMFRIEDSGKTAVCDIDEYTALEEQRLGRYKIISEVKEAPPVVKAPQPPTGFGISKDAISLGNYYGCGDLENFRKKVAGMDRDQMVKFAKETMDVDMSTHSYTKKMINELCLIMETKISEALAKIPPQPAAPVQPPEIKT